MRVVDLIGNPHRRYDPLADEWVLVSPGRVERPWLGAMESSGERPRPAHDPDCYLCPGNTRADGSINPPYRDTFVFTNDFPALRPEGSGVSVVDGMLRAETEHGTCRVLCFSPRHDLDLGAMPTSDVRRVVDLWAAESADLGERYRWVQVFENRGEAMGASNPHPHGQVWAGKAVPTRAAREEASQRKYRDSTGRSLLVDYVGQESAGPRAIIDGREWLVVVPFWAVWPYETLIVARHPVARLPELEDAQRDDLALTLRNVLGGYDRLFDRPFPYSMGWHQAPFDGRSADHWQLHAHVYPPLLRANARKFMVGYELLAEPQRDLTPEDASAHLFDAVALGAD
jgi:UDPglucose--hexose-1-phosphate uridylyltransferase